jgi:hypothetical protein
MITVTLTDLEARKLRDLLEKRGNKDADLARIHYKITRLLMRPAVKRKYGPHNNTKHLIKRGSDDD